MRLLLDTHSLIWYLYADPRLPSGAREAIDDPSNEVFFSLVSIWEIAIKRSIDRLNLRDETSHLAEIARFFGMRTLPIELSHVLAVQNLPPHHGDPFDRLLVAQAQIQGMTIVCHDTAFDRYGVERLW